MSYKAQSSVLRGKEGQDVGYSRPASVDFGHICQHKCEHTQSVRRERVRRVSPILQHDPHQRNIESSMPRCGGGGKMQWVGHYQERQLYGVEALLIQPAQLGLGHNRAAPSEVSCAANIETLKHLQ